MIDGLHPVAGRMTDKARHINVAQQRSDIDVIDDIAIASHILWRDHLAHVFGILAARFLAGPGYDNLRHQIAQRRVFVIPSCGHHVLHRGRAFGIFGGRAPRPAHRKTTDHHDGRHALGSACGKGRGHSRALRDCEDRRAFKSGRVE